MEVVHQTNQIVGSFDWELPHGISDMLAAFPATERTNITAQLKEYIEEHLLLLLDILVDKDPVTGILILRLQNKETKAIFSI